MENTNHRSFSDFFFPIVFRVLDFATVGLAFYLAHYFRFKHIKINFEYEMLALLACAAVVASASLFGVYNSWRGKHRVEMLGRVFLAWSVAFLAILALLVLSKKGQDYSRLWIGYSYLSSLSMAVILRLSIYTILSFLRKRGFNQKRVLVIGSSVSAEQIRERISQQVSSGFLLFSAMDKQFNNLFGAQLSVNSVDDLEKIIKQHNIPEIWFCLSLKDYDFLDKALFALRHSTVNVRYVPDMSGFRLLNHQLTNIAGMPTIDLSSSPLDGLNGILKRIEDIVLALSIILLISPLLFLIALTVKLSSQGPILFKQLRHGADGKPIKIYKFRSMYVHKAEAGLIQQATKNDVRVTPLGSFLRRTSLDELPQFYNVLQGRMSVVGPRPHAIEHNEYYKELVESYMQRHKVKPGITGWAQVNGLRGETQTIEKMQKRVEFDLYYIDNWSLTFDIKIVLMTVFKLFGSENVY